MVENYKAPIDNEKGGRCLKAGANLSKGGKKTQVFVKGCKLKTWNMRELGRINRRVVVKEVK